MQPMPLVGAEVQRIRAAFEAASLELGAALTAMTEIAPDALGTPPADAAVEAGLDDLRSSLQRLRDTADDCAQVTGRHVSASGADSGHGVGQP